MFQWNIEDLMLLNEKSRAFIKYEKIYNCEHKLSREEKIEFVDKMQDGNLSYLLDILYRFNKEKVNLKHDDKGSIRTATLKAWFKKMISKT